MTWAMRLKRVFGMDIEVCSECGGKLKVISSIEEPEVIEQILNHLGLDSKVPEPHSPRASPEEDDFEQFCEKCLLFFLYSIWRVGFQSLGFGLQSLRGLTSGRVF